MERVEPLKSVLFNRKIIILIEISNLQVRSFLDKTFKTAGHSVSEETLNFNLLTPY